MIRAACRSIYMAAVWMGVTARSSRWPGVRKAFIADHPRCEACGSGESLEVHHVKPFHLHPELELVRANLMTLCEGLTKCHLRVGHLGSWKTINKNARADAARALAAAARPG